MKIYVWVISRACFFFSNMNSKKIIKTAICFESKVKVIKTCIIDSATNTIVRQYTTSQSFTKEDEKAQITTFYVNWLVSTSYFHKKYVIKNLICVLRFFIWIRDFFIWISDFFSWIYKMFRFLFRFETLFFLFFIFWICDFFVWISGFPLK
jgi:hypothetical protein